MYSREQELEMKLNACIKDRDGYMLSADRWRQSAFKLTEELRETRRYQAEALKLARKRVMDDVLDLAVMHATSLRDSINRCKTYEAAKPLIQEHNVWGSVIGKIMNLRGQEYDTQALQTVVWRAADEDVQPPETTGT